MQLHIKEKYFETGVLLEEKNNLYVEMISMQLLPVLPHYNRPV
jgi:hypothetical protein